MKPIVLILSKTDHSKLLSLPPQMPPFQVDFLFIGVDGNDEAKAINQWVANYKGSCDSVILLPENSILLPLYSEFIETYKEEQGEILLPLVELSTKDDKGTLHFKAFLNSYIWQSGITEEVGYLDMKLAKQQLDNTLYGALIPIVALNIVPFNEEMPCYFHNEWLARVIDCEMSVKGIPKLVCKLVDLDYTYNTVLDSVKQDCFDKVATFTTKLVTLEKTL